MRLEITYESEHNFYTGFTENISSGGLFVATHQPRKIGDMIDLTFSLPGLGQPCHVLGRVRWVREYHGAMADSTPGMGIEFVSLEERERRAIEAFIKYREPIFFDEV